MVEIVKVSKEGVLLEIKEISDLFRDQEYDWPEEE